MINIRIFISSFSRYFIFILWLFTWRLRDQDVRALGVRDRISPVQRLNKFTVYTAEAVYIGGKLICSGGRGLYIPYLILHLISNGRLTTYWLYGHKIAENLPSEPATFVQRLPNVLQTSTTTLGSRCTNFAASPCWFFLFIYIFILSGYFLNNVYRVIVLLSYIPFYIGTAFNILYFPFSETKCHRLLDAEEAHFSQAK